jgi:N-methylhydantoinase B
VTAPPGTIVNVQPPGPVSLNTTSGGTIVKFVADAVLAQMAATSERWRGEVMAKRVGVRSARHAGVNQYGSYYVGSFGSVDAGGARAHSDGVDSGGATLITDVNVEWFESHYPFLYLLRRHIRDGGGAGKYRGGVGQEVALTLHDAPEGRLKGVAFGVAGLRNSGRGVFGGYPGAPSALVIHKATRLEELLSQNRGVADLSTLGGAATPLSYSEFELRDNDVFVMTSCNGGGYGDPLTRDPFAVAGDVEKGLVSPASARDVYGVVLDGDHVHLAETEARRRGLIALRATGLDRTGLQPRAAAEANSTETVHPLRENLEVTEVDGSLWIRCAKCREPLSPLDAEWSAACNRKLLPPTAAGALMEPLVGKFLLEQLSCPQCSALFNTDVVEAEAQMGGELAR